MHLKRNKAPLSWGIRRKGTKYLVRQKYNLKNSVPLLIVLREMLGLAKTRKEADKLLDMEKVKVNGKIVRDKKYALMLFDIVNVNDRNFRLGIKNKKFSLESASEKSHEKIVKITGKKVLKGGKLQVNLSDGRNYIVREKMKTRDSVVVDLKENKIKDVIKFDKGCKVLVISGKHIGEEGIVESIDEKHKNALVKTKESKLNLNFEVLIAI